MVTMSKNSVLLMMIFYWGEKTAWRPSAYSACYLLTLQQLTRTCTAVFVPHLLRVHIKHFVTEAMFPASLGLNLNAW
jgi:hypothetical protein